MGSESEDDGDHSSENVPQAKLPVDEDWTRFVNLVNTSTKPWEDLPKLLYKKGDAKHDTLGLFAKLITRSVSVKQENGQLSDKCGYTILVACYRLCSQTNLLPSETTNDMLNMIMTEVRHFSTKSMSKSVEYCMEYMKSTGEDLPNRWMELFAKIIAELFQHCNIEFEGDNLDGREYKTYIINALCRLEWGSKNAPTMIAVIRELPEISTTDLESVMAKVKSCMSSCEPPVIPPLTHQLLYFAGNSKPAKILEVLKDYFSNLDYYSVRRGVDPRVKSLGTVLYYFIEGSKQYEGVVREVLRILKIAMYDRELLRSPFILALSLSLSTQPHLKSPFVEAFKSAILRSYQERDWSFMSTWCNFARGELENDIKDMFDFVLTSKLLSLECVVEGVMNVGTALLNWQKLNRENNFCATKCRELGSHLVFSVVKEDKKYLPIAMKELLKYSDPYSIECLSKCFEASTRLLTTSQYSGKMHELITQFPLMTPKTAAPIIKSLLPVFHLSSSLLDSLLIMTRKGVWKSVQSRLVSVQALILVLSYSPIIKEIGQDKFSQTQTLFGSSQKEERIARYTGIFDNDALCFEVMSILRRFFTLQVEVRQQLYYGLHSTIRLNPELTNLICSNVHNHVKSFMTDNESAISFDKILTPAKLNSTDPVVIEEDLGLLIQCLCCVAIRGRHVYSDNPDNIPESVVLCEGLIAKWIELAAELNLEDIYDISNLILENAGGTRPMESVAFIRNVLIIQFLQVMEALLEYILSFKDGDPEQALTIFKKIEEFKIPIEVSSNNKGKAKTAGKNKGPGKNKAKDKNQSIDKDLDTSTKSIDEPKAKKLTKAYSKVNYDHIIALSSVENIIREIYKSGKGSCENRPVSSMKKSVLFEKFVLDVVKEKSNLLKQKKTIRERNTKVEDIIAELCSIFGVLWKRCISKVEKFNSHKDDDVFEDKENFDITEIQFEIMLTISEIVLFQRPALIKKLMQAFETEEMDEDGDLYAELNSQWQLMAVRYGSNVKSITTMTYLLGILNTFLSSLSAKNASSTFAKNALYWCMKYYGKQNRDINDNDPRVLESLLNTMFTASNKSEHMNEDFILIARQARSELGDSVTESRPGDGKPSWLVREDTAESVVCGFAAYVEHQLVFVNSIITRIKALCQNPKEIKDADGDCCDERADLERKGRECCKFLTNLVKIASEIVPCEFPVGKSSVAITKLIPKVYIALAGLTEYHCADNKKHKLASDYNKFRELAKFVGSQFKVNVEGFITYIEIINRENAEEIFKNCKGKKKGVFPAALKRQFANDTKNIPTIVYHLEKYEQHLFTLASKLKVNILVGTKLSTARDFRIRIDKLKEAFAEMKDGDTEASEGETMETSDVEPEGSPQRESSPARNAVNSRAIPNAKSSMVNNVSGAERKKKSKSTNKNDSKRKLSDADEEPGASRTVKKRKPIG